MAELINRLIGRYGWNDDYILSIPYSRLMQIIEAMFEEEERETKQQLFLGWQIHLSTSTSPITNFDDYCKMFLPEKQEQVVYEKLSKEEVMKKTDDILNLFKEKGGVKNNELI